VPARSWSANCRSAEGRTTLIEGNLGSNHRPTSHRSTRAPRGPECHPVSPANLSRNVTVVYSEKAGPSAISCVAFPARSVAHRRRNEQCSDPSRDERCERCSRSSCETPPETCALLTTGVDGRKSEPQIRTSSGTSLCGTRKRPAPSANTAPSASHLPGMKHGPQATVAYVTPAIAS
jgi:hypothetical protein